MATCDLCGRELTKITTSLRGPHKTVGMRLTLFARWLVGKEDQEAEERLWLCEACGEAALAWIRSQRKPRERKSTCLQR
jgi:hypothetical protein